MGLTKKFNGGTIVCSDITCALVKTILGVSQDLMLVAKVGESLKIGEFVVTFVDANQ